MRSDRGQRYPAAMRLKGAATFRVVHRGGVRVRQGPLMVCGMPNELGHVRLGLAVGRRVGGAVKRNLIKRRLREAVRLDRTAASSGYDVIISVRPHVPLPLTEYQRLLLDAFATLHRRWTQRNTTDA